jgi:hypothetical protein
MCSRPVLAAVLAMLSGVACSKRSGSPSTSLSASAPPAPPVRNDGTDARTPVLSPKDEGFVDRGMGMGWYQRCKDEEREGKYGWAMAACEKGLAQTNMRQSTRATLYYLQGMSLEASHAFPGAKAKYQHALENGGTLEPGQAAVEAAVARVDKAIRLGTPGVTFPCGDNLRCAKDQWCCSETGCFDQADASRDCADLAFAVQCDKKTNEPCRAPEQCTVTPDVDWWHCDIEDGGADSGG